jgi:hypothetical protein
MLNYQRVSGCDLQFWVMKVETLMNHEYMSFISKIRQTNPNYIVLNMLVKQ